MMSDQCSAEEGKDETQSPAVTGDIDSATLTAEVDSAQDEETATIANNSSPSPKSETPVSKIDTPIDDNQNDSIASLSQATGNVNSVLQDEPDSKNTTSDFAPGSGDIKSSASDDSKQLDASLPLSEVDQDAGIDTAMIETASLDKLTEQGTPKSSLEIVGKEASESGNNAQSEEVEKVCLVDEINVDSETKLTSDSEEKSSESVDSSLSLPDSESNKNSGSILDQPLNSCKENEEKSTEGEESGTTKSIQKKVVEKSLDSVDSLVEEPPSQKVKNSNSCELLGKNDETVTPEADKQLEKVASEQNVEPVLDINQTEMELVCKISDISSKPDAKQTMSDPEQTTSDLKQVSDAEQAVCEAKQTTPEAKETTSEGKHTTPEAEQTTPEVKQTIPEVKQATLDAKQTTPGVKQTTLDAKQTTPEVKQTTLDAKQTTPEVKQTTLDSEQTTSGQKQLTSDAQQTTSKAKQTPPEAKQILSDPEETACGAKQTTPEAKQTTSEAKQTSDLEQPTSDAKQTSDPKQIPSDAEQTMSEVMEKTPDTKQTPDQKQTPPMSEVKEKTSDVELSVFEGKETASEAKHTFDVKETKAAADCKKLEDKEATSNDNKSVSDVHEENAEISDNTQEVLESICVEKTDPGTVKSSDSSSIKDTEVTNQSAVTESSKDFVNLQVSDSSNQQAESENSLVNEIDVDSKASDDCETANDKSVKNSVDCTLKASKNNSPVVEEPLIGETVPSLEKIPVDEGDEKSGLVGAECKTEHSVSVLSSSDDKVPPVKENGETSNSVDESVNDLPLSTKDSVEMEPKIETKIQNKIDEAVVEPKAAEKALESAREVVKSVERSEILPSNAESSVAIVEAKLAEKEPENAAEDVKLVEEKSGITERSVSPLVTSELQSQEHSGGANSLPKIESNKTDLESAIEAVKEEAENIKSMKGSTSKSSDTKEPKHLNKTVEQSTEKDTPSVKNDGALNQTEKPESITLAPNVAVLDKINGTAVSTMETNQEVSDKPSEISSKELLATDMPCNIKISSVESKQEQQKELSEAGKKVPSTPNKPKTTKVMPSLREIRKVPLKPVSKEVKPVSAAATTGEKLTLAKSSMSVSIVTKPKSSETDSDSVETASIGKQVIETKFGEVSESPNDNMKAQEDSGKSISRVASDQKAGKTQLTLNDSKQMTIKKVENAKPVEVASSNGSKSIVKPRNSIENDPLLNITSECRVELEITKIPANCQLKTEPGGKPVFVLKKDSASFSTQENADKKQKSLLKNFALNSGQTSKMMTSTRPLNKVSGMTRVSSDDSAVVSRPVGAKRPGRKRAITIDMTRPSVLQPPAVKVVKMDPSLKSRANMAQMQRTFPKAGPSPKTTSALEMLLMNRGVTHNIPISDASVANFCQVEQLVSEPDMYSTPINQLKKLSKGPADSILKQIAFGSQQFGAITISPVKPTPSPQVVRPVPSGVPLKQGPRPAPVVRSSSVDNVIEGVVAGQGVISDKCLLELNSAGEPKKKRGRPRKIIPGASPQPHQGESLQCAPDLFFVPEEKESTMRTLAPKPVSVSVSTPDAAEVSSPVSATPVVTPTESEVETSEVEEGTESEGPKKSASGRVVRSCTVKESKKKGNATNGSKSPRSGKKKKDDEPAEPDPEEEARKQKALEDEVKRKAELKEKRQQERREKMELRTKALAEKKAKLKRRAEERKRQYYEKKQRLQEEKAEMERQRALAPPVNFSEETQMGDENESAGELIRNKKGRMEVIDPESSKEFKVHQVAEYQWPLQGGEFFMLQEQISQYLGVKSFKRKYPDIKRRTIEAEERTFLCDSGLVSETMCDLGLTALRSADVLDIMFADFHDKYEEFRQHLRDMQAKEFSLKQLALAGKPTGDQLDSIERAVQSAARWNSALNKSRQESRRCCLDLQTFVIQYPRSRLPKISQDLPKIGHYPISLIPGQFTDYYKPYSAADLRYLPLNTVLYGPIKPYNVIVRESQNDYLSESEDSSSSDGSSSSSSDGSDSEDSGEEVAMDIDVPGQEGAICKICNGNKNKNKRNKPEVLIHCAQCTGSCHPSCLDLSLEMVPHIQRYEWQCTDCKKCLKCKQVSDEDKMLFCDLCDRGYHFYCVGLRKVPVGRWHCQECAICASCSCHVPGPDENSFWHHEFKRGGKGGKNTYLRSFCENCAKDQTPVDGNILKRES